jgi:hypothetical protein
MYILIFHSFITIIHEQKRSIFPGESRALRLEYGNNTKRLILIARLILKSKKQAKMLGFPVNIGYPSKNARYPGGQRHGFLLLFPYLLVR